MKGRQNYDPHSWISWLDYYRRLGRLGSLEDSNRDAQMGIGLNILVGIVGGLIGGWLLTLAGIQVSDRGSIFSFLTCLLGAVVLLWIVNKVSGHKK